MPHSPRWHDAGDGGRLWLLDSDTSWFGHAGRAVRAGSC
jgi:hypothetical protein